MKIGHGPATVIGALREWQPRVRNVLAPVIVRTLREKECGDEPRYPREAFLLETRIESSAAGTNLHNDNCDGIDRGFRASYDYRANWQRPHGDG